MCAYTWPSHRVVLAREPGAEGRDARACLQRELDEGLVPERIAAGLMLRLECNIEPATVFVTLVRKARSLALDALDLAIARTEQLARLAVAAKLPPRTC
jgi:hypothetical protein